MKDILNIFQKRLVFELDVYQILEYRFTQICCTNS